VGFTHKKAGKDACAQHFSKCTGRMASVPSACESMENHALGACHLFLGPHSLIFRRFRSSSSNNLPRNLGTKFFPLVTLMRPLESSFLVFLSLHKSWDVLDLPICMISS